MQNFNHRRDKRRFIWFSRICITSAPHSRQRLLILDNREVKGRRQLIESLTLGDEGADRVLNEAGHCIGRGRRDAYQPLTPVSSKRCDSDLLTDSTSWPSFETARAGNDNK
jgi:hypothetical protein